jgi:citrate lyase subunit alpha/citrate CoA-transferase
MSERAELAHNAAGRSVPTMVNGRPQIPFQGIGKFQPRGRKATTPIRSSRDYPDNGDKRVPDLESALRK